MAFMAARVPLDDEFKSWFRELKDKYKKLDLSWESEDDLHITLKFFAGLNTQETENLAEKLESYSFNHQPFVVTTTVLRSFENPNENILWLAMEESDELNKLQKRIDVIFEAVGIMPSRFDFVPHVTLARYKKDISESGIFSEKLSTKINVSSIHLMKRKVKEEIKENSTKFFDVASYEL